MKKDYYQILGVNKNATDDEIKKAFRKTSMLYHPDKQVGKSESEKQEAEEKFKEANEAYSVLSDPQKRQQYDRFGTVDPNMMGGTGDIDFGEIFRNFAGGGFGSHFGFGGFGQQQQEQRVVKGSDCRIRIDYTLEDAYNEITKKYRYNRYVSCPDCDGPSICEYCNGTGIQTVTSTNGFSTFIQQTPCPHCNGSGLKLNGSCKTCGGSGVVSKMEDLEIQIPAHALLTKTMKFVGKGNMPGGNGIPGDLVVLFNLVPHSVFGVADNKIDLYCKTSVNVLDCITGCEKEVSCIDGTKVKIQLPKFAKENTKVVVTGKGMKVQGRTGDMIVYIQQSMPTDLNKDEKKLIEELKNCKHFKK